MSSSRAKGLNLSLSRTRVQWRRLPAYRINRYDFMWGSGGVVPGVYNIGTRWMREVTFVVLYL